MTVKQSTSFCRAQLCYSATWDKAACVRHTLAMCQNNSHRIVRFSPADNTETLVFSIDFHTYVLEEAPCERRFQRQTAGGCKR